MRLNTRSEHYSPRVTGSFPVSDAYGLLISTKSSYVQKSIDAQTKVELNIPQLTIANIGKFGERLTKSFQSSRVQGSIPVKGNFFAEFILLQYNSGKKNDLF